MTQQKNIYIGLACMSAWILFSACGKLLTSNLDQNIDPFVLSTYLFLITNIIFLVINFKNLKKLIGKTQKHLKLVACLNLATLGCWAVVMYPLKYMEPSLVDTIALGVTPIFTLILSTFIYKSAKPKTYECVLSALLLVVIIYISTLCFFDKTAVKHTSHLNMAISIALCIIAGISVAANTIYTKKLINNGFTIGDVLSIRFILLIIFSVAALFASHAHLTITFVEFKQIVALALLLLLIPLYLIQVAITNLEPMTIAMSIPFMPVLTMLLEFLEPRFYMNYYSISAVGLSLLLLLSGTYLRFKNANY